MFSTSNLIKVNLLEHAVFSLLLKLMPIAKFISLALSNFHIPPNLQFIALKAIIFLTISNTCGPLLFLMHWYMVHTHNYSFTFSPTSLGETQSWYRLSSYHFIFGTQKISWQHL